MANILTPLFINERQEGNIHRTKDYPANVTLDEKR